MRLISPFQKADSLVPMALRYFCHSLRIMSKLVSFARNSERESRGCAVSMTGLPIRILLVGETKDACRLRGLFDTGDSNQFQISHVAGLDLAAERLSSDPADVLVADLGTKQREGRAFVQAARAAAPDTPMVILAESEDESLAVEALRLGAQDVVIEEALDRIALVRPLRYSIERHRLQMTLQNLFLI